MEKTVVFEVYQQARSKEKIDINMPSVSKTKSSLPCGSVEKYGTLTERYLITVPGRSSIQRQHIKYDDWPSPRNVNFSENRYIIGAKIEIKYDRSKWKACGLDHYLSQPLSLFDPLSCFELEIGGQRMDRTYMFAIDIMQKLFYGTKLPLLKKTDTQVIITLPLMLELLQVGNVLPCVEYHNIMINCEISYNTNFPSQCNLLSISSHADLVLETLNCKEYSLVDAYCGELSSGERAVIQQQFSGAEYISGGIVHHKIRLPFNHLCHNIFISFRRRDCGNLIQSPYLLKSLKLQCNGRDTICVDNPSQIYGKSSQFICPKFSPNQLNNSGERPVFPTEVWVNIFSFLKFPEARKLSLTCKFLWNVSKHNLVWSHMTKEYGDELPGWFCMPFFDHAITDYQSAIMSSLNFSIIDSATLIIELNENVDDLECFIFTTNFNALRSMDGMMGLTYSM